MKFKLSEDKSKLLLVESTKSEYHQLKLHLTRHVDNYRFKTRFKLGVWDGTIDHFHDGRIDFGLWHEVVKCCKEHGYPFELDKEQFPNDPGVTRESVAEFCKEFYTDHQVKGQPFTPHEHQIDAVYRLLRHRYGLIEVATAGGKSLIFSTLVFYVMRKVKPDAKVLLVVPATSLVVQFMDEMLDYNLGFGKENKTPLDLRIEEIMSDHPRKHRGDLPPNIYIGTYQSLVKWPVEWFRQFDVVCADEGHLCKAQSLKEILSKTFGTATYRFGLSGTYPPEETCEYLSIVSLTGPKLVTVGARELIDKKLISDVKIQGLILNHDDRDFAENVFAIRKSGNGKKAFELEKAYIQASDRRTRFLSKLVGKLNSNTLVLFHNIEYGKSLYEHFRSNVIGKQFYYIDGDTDVKKRERIREILEDTSGDVKVLVASYGTFSTGINVKAIMNIVFADSFKSDQIVRQSIGRGLRKHAEKDRLHVFDITDVFHKDFNNILHRHYAVRRDKIYKKQQLPFEEVKLSLS